MHRVGCRAEKSPVFEKKYLKKPITFYWLKLQILHYIFKKPLKNEYRIMCHTLIYVFKKNIFLIFLNPFLLFFSTLPSTQTMTVIGLIFSSMNWPWQIGLCTCFSTRYTYSLRAFYRGGATNAPQAIHRFRPPSLYRVKNGMLNYL